MHPGAKGGATKRIKNDLIALFFILLKKILTTFFSHRLSFVCLLPVSTV